MSGLRDFNIDFSVADAPPVRREKKTPVSPIRTEELIDLDNLLPMATRGSVQDATAYVRRFADEAEDNGYGQKFADRLVEARVLGPESSEFQSTANQVDDLVLAWKRSSPKNMNDAELRWVRARVIDNMLGTGAIEPLRRDPRVTEIIVRAHAPHEIATAGGNRMGGGCVTEIYGVGLVDAPGVIFGDDQEVLDFISRIHPDGKRPTPTHPNMSAALPDGSRLEAAHPCVTDGKSTFLALRRHPEEAHTLLNLIEWGTVTEELAAELASMVRMRLNLVVAGGTSSGKALDIDTPIPTPNGFVRMGDLRVGNLVYSDEGKPCRVTGAYAPMVDRHCYEVVFSDGSSVVADAEHLWSMRVSATRPTRRRGTHHRVARHRLPRFLGKACARAISRIEDACSRRHKPQVKTTVDIVRALRAGLVCSIPVAHRVEGAIRDLPLDPFEFGSWFAGGSPLPEPLSDVERLRATLPEAYVFSSITQRKDLLRGLLAGCGFQITAEDQSIAAHIAEDRVVQAIRTVVSSLGGQVVVSSSSGGGCVLSLPLHCLDQAPPRETAYKRIVRVTPVDSRAVRCISVASRSKLFLAGMDFNPTHNTTTLNALTPFLPEHVHLSIIEDTPELKDPSNLRLVSRRVSRPGSGDVDDVTIRSHIRAALRSRPDVIIIGEVRGPEAVDALTAMNTGHEGSMVTCHSNSAHETVVRLESMMSEAGEISEAAATHKIAASVDIIIHQARLADGRRRITGVYEVEKPALDSTKKVESVVLHPLWTLDRVTGDYTKHADPSDGLLATRNVGERSHLDGVDIRLTHEVARRGSPSAMKRREE